MNGATGLLLVKLAARARLADVIAEPGPGDRHVLSLISSHPQFILSNPFR